jgi:hypothetical protein
MANLKVGGRLNPDEFLGALPANPRSIRGMTASLCIVDEAAHIGTDDPAMHGDDAPAHVAPEPPAK